MSVADQAAIKQHFNDIIALLPFGLNLTEDERKSITKMADKRLAFVTKVMEYSHVNAPLVPGYLSLPEADKDFNLESTLRTIEALSAQVLEIIDDTRMAAGHEAYDYALAFYGAVQEAAKRNVPGAESIFLDLKQVFEQQGPQGDVNPTPPPPPPPQPVQ